MIRIKMNSTEQTGSFLTLLLCLVGLMLVAPFAEFRHDTLIVDVGNSVVFFAGIWSLFHNRKILWVGLLLFFPTITARWCYIYWPQEFLLYVISVGTALFMLFNSYAIFTYILHQRKPRPDTIYGGVCIYFFLGFLWSELYALTELFAPGSFSVSAAGLSLANMKAELSYFSFVTLATLGYGEITPVGDMARTLAVMEAVVGQMFVAVFIARLVGFHLAGPLQSKGENT
ncbi:potassium channel family protein [Desulfogranum marinum]|uniref:potassium channel family protein n=1 Tax=Desulfogranum marinum TaxID=453220 RepID=UPI00196495BD|nr:potassium channel family protein [Desulfogranum marinum]MBM9512037.1 two pore domain potassium channel family protein [Desulfogranum marinum]